jgi:hypothetical protein
MTAPQSEGLRPKLERAQATLRSALQQACSADLQDADTGELIKLEEVLAIANEAAKEAVSVRRRLGQTARSDDGPDPKAGNHREFDDDKGVRWIVFAVHPSTATRSRAGLREPYQNGWLAFDCGMETRRLAPIPDGWLELAIEELQAMCARAQVAPRRVAKKRSD